MSIKNIVMFAMSAAVASGQVYGQSVKRSEWQCQSAKSKLGQHSHAAKPTVGSTEEDKYDVNYVKLDVSMTNVATTIGGSVTTVAKSVVPSLTSYVFELEPPLVIDSVKIDGAIRPVTSVTDVHTVSLATPVAMGGSFTAQVFYHGTPVSGTNSSAKGINALRSPSWGNFATFTLSESYRAREWWPCKQSLTDKIDSSDIWITVDDSLKAGSNGLLKAITPMAGGRSRYEWQERYPIDYYLISAAVAKYVDHSYYMHFTASPDSMLVQNYIYDNPLTLPNFLNVIDSTDEQVNFFSSYFGRYPFWKEKYGHAMGPLSGGMEHQTMTTLGFFESWLVAHELGHQWFGDNVTCASWTDIVMNEGFASYCEYMYLDHFRSHAVAIADMVDRQENVMSELDGSTYVDDTTSEPRIFSSRLTYDKGACTVHLLRHVINNDTYFFDLLRGWQTAKAYSTGTTMEFKELAKTMLGPVVNGISLDTFFQQWFYGQGFPAYAATWNKVGDDVFVQLNQSGSAPSSVNLFKVPLELRLRTAASGDTVIRIVIDQASQLLHFKWSKPMTSLSIDPNNWLTDSITSIAKDASLGVPGALQAIITVHPNPATDSWVAGGIPAGCLLTVTDVAGRALYATTVNGGDIVVPAAKFAPGIYLLTVTNSGGDRRTMKVVRE